MSSSVAVRTTADFLIMLDAAAMLGAGRRAHAAADWSVAFDTLTAAHAIQALDVEDLALLADCAWWLGRVPESLALSEEVFRSYRALDRTTDAAATALRLSLLWLTRGDWTVGTAWLHRAERLLEGVPDGPVHGYLVYLDTSFVLLDGDELWAPTKVERLADLARRFPDPAVEALSIVAAGMAELRRGSTRRGFALLNEAMLPVLANKVPAVWAGDIYCTTIHVCHELADFRRMEEWTIATEQWCEQFGSEAIYTGICRVHRLELRSARGEWADVEARINRESTDLAGGNAWIAGEGFYQLGEIRRLRGDAAGARSAYDLTRASGIDPQPGEALLTLREGDSRSAWAMIVASLAERDRMARVRLLRAGVEIALADGRPADAASFLDELREAAEHYGSPGFRAWALHAEGMLAVAGGDAARARSVLRDAVAAFREHRQPYETARVLLLLATAHELAAGPDEAARARTQAEEILATLGAEPPRVPSAAARTGPLTTRESEVLGCVAEGASNRDVAARLYISEKTVGRHLANIYQKIGVGSRTAAAAWWHEHMDAAGRAIR